MDCRGAFQTVLDSKCCVTGDNGYFTFQTIIDIAGARGAISDVVCMGSPVIIIIYKKKLTNKYTKKIGIVN